MATSRRYMEGSEFKARQSAFEYFCASSIEFLQEFKKDCLRGWKKLFEKAAPKVQTQLEINFNKTFEIVTRHFMKLEDQLPKYKY